MPDIEQKHRMVRELVGDFGRGFAEECRFRVTNNPASLFQLLLLSVLIDRSDDYRLAVRAARAMRDQGWDTARRLAGSPHEQRVAVLREVGWRQPPALAATVPGDLAQVVLDRYRGDLRRLRTEAKRNSARIRALLTELPGVDNGAVDLFFREVQAFWPEVGPFADRHALMAARRLALGRSARDLAELVRGGGTEKLSWLVGALARIDLDNRYNTLGLTRT